MLFTISMTLDVDACRFLGAPFLYMKGVYSDHIYRVKEIITKEKQWVIFRAYKS